MASSDQIRGVFNQRCPKMGEYWCLSLNNPNVPRFNELDGSLLDAINRTIQVMSLNIAPYYNRIIPLVDSTINECRKVDGATTDGRPLEQALGQLLATEETWYFGVRRAS
jgi:hypothetical protein